MAFPSGSGQTTHALPSTPFFLGGAPNAANEVVAGAMDDVALWTRDLPADAVAGLARGTFSPLTAPTALLPGPVVPTDLPSERVTLAAGETTYYFRREFAFNEDPSQTRLELRYLLDDGAVFYLNGQEIHRQNMPAGNVTASTRATAEVGDIGLSATIALPATALVHRPKRVSRRGAQEQRCRQ